MKGEESIAALCRQLKKLVANVPLRNQVLTKASPAWGWYYLLTDLDDYSPYIVSWKLFTGFSSGDVTGVLDEPIAATGVEKQELREYLAERSMRHTRGRPYHPMTQGKIERYHRTLSGCTSRWGT